jgi:hypothetical protein
MEDIPRYRKALQGELLEEGKTERRRDFLWEIAEAHSSHYKG